MKSHTHTLVGIVLSWAAITACNSEASDGAELAQGAPDGAPAGHGEHESASPAAGDDDFQGCPEGIPQVAPGLRASGEHLAVQVLTALPEEPERYLNQWMVELQTLDGELAPDAEITRGETFMPIHGHDGRVQPEPMALPEPGRIEVDRLNFTMRGPWEVRFWLQLETGQEDYVVFDVCVAK